MKTKRYEAKDEDELLRLIDEDQRLGRSYRGAFEVCLLSCEEV